MKNLLKLLIICLLMQFAGCSGTGNNLFYRAVERSDVEIVKGKAGLIRTIYCDLYIEHVDNDGWKYLKDVPLYCGTGKGNPTPACFHFIIVNTWKKPFQLDRVELIHDGEVIKSEDFLFIKDKDYMKKRYAVNLEPMMKKRRILTDDNLLKEIDFTDDTVEYRLDFIAPGDRVSFFRFFSWFPVKKTSKIRVTIKYFDLKKVIDFDIGRFEYNDIMIE